MAAIIIKQSKAIILNSPFSLTKPINGMNLYANILNIPPADSRANNKPVTSKNFCQLFFLLQQASKKNNNKFRPK